MAKDSSKKRKNTASVDMLDTDIVREWLSANPDFFDVNSDLIAELIGSNRHTENGVVNMQSFLVERLQKQVAALKEIQAGLLSAARANLQTQQMVHKSVQAILSATSVSHFVHILTQDLPEYLDVDVVTLCVEDGSIPLPAMTGLQRLKSGNINKANWAANDILMRPSAPKSKAVFGPAKDLVASDALIRLHVPLLNAPAMLAIGSREIGHFHNDQGTELLSFLANCVQSLLQMWLEQQSIS
ncbi:DUF484 family protein [Sneathiella glossodoripedis]|uniref:DUF484 family protein n=1 Tax=Sneathiella glossodoripedis TaxID=418853 RepID=UPI00046EE3A4|nr:DUF484 family protein [Sneathiella glossodoripedis]